MSPLQMIAERISPTWWSQKQEDLGVLWWMFSQISGAGC